LQEILDFVTGTDASVSQRKFLCKGWREEFVFQNPEPHDIIVDVWRVARKRDSSTVLLKHIWDGMNVLDAGRPAGSTATAIGSIHNSLMMSTTFRHFFKIMSKKQIILRPGQCFRRVLKSSKNFIMNAADLLNSATYRRGEKHWMLSFMGCPLPSHTTTPGSVNQATFSDVLLQPLIQRTYYVAGIMDPGNSVIGNMDANTFIPAAIAAGSELTAGPPVYIGAADRQPREG